MSFTVGVPPASGTPHNPTSDTVAPIYCPIVPTCPTAAATDGAANVPTISPSSRPRPVACYTVAGLQVGMNHTGRVVRSIKERGSAVNQFAEIATRASMLTDVTF